MKHPNYNRHHIVPVSKDGANTPENIIRLKTNVHAAIHLIFSNRTPLEQIEFLLEGYNSQVLTNRFKREIKDILYKEEEGYYYKNGVLVPKK